MLFRSEQQADDGQPKRLLKLAPGVASFCGIHSLLETSLEKIGFKINELLGSIYQRFWPRRRRGSANIVNHLKFGANVIATDFATLASSARDRKGRKKESQFD